MKCETCGKVKRGRPHPTGLCKVCRNEQTVNQIVVGSDTSVSSELSETPVVTPTDA